MEIATQVCMILHRVAASLENAYALFPTLGPKCDSSGFCS